MKQPTAAIILIGNELLSGRTQDKNMNYIARELTAMGIRLKEARVISDTESVIIRTVNEIRKNYDYVFTTGGIGPTHDDITSESIAKAFDVKWVLHEEVRDKLAAYYAGRETELNDARLRMAHIPEGATLIDNPVTTAPGFRMENVYVFAGVPSIMQAMFQAAKPSLKGGDMLHSVSVSTNMPEGDLAAYIQTMEEKFKIEVGSYPFQQQGVFGTTIVMRGYDVSQLESCANMLRSYLEDHGVDIFELDPGLEAKH